MVERRFRVILLATALTLSGIVVGIVASHALSAGTRPATKEEVVAAEMAALDERLAGLPPLQQSFVLVAKRVTPAVVTVHSEKIIKRPSLRMQIPERFREFFNDDFFFDSPGGGEQRVPGLGSGVIVDSEGIILTNNHVVSQAAEVKVTLSDDRTLEAEVLGADPESDIAVLRVDATGLPYIPIGDSDDIEVGEWVMAVGNPFSEALRHTVTAGIISAKGRGNIGLATFEDFIQTDAAINHGNSGGALVNMQGELIGINTAIVSRSGSFAGVGFAIPSNMAKRVKDSVLEYGKVKRGYLGVYPQNVDKNLAEALGLDKHAGAIVGSVEKGTPAEEAGLKRGDVITEINGKKVKGRQDVFNIVGDLEPGSKAKLKIIREGKEMEVTVTLTERTNGEPEEEEGEYKGEAGDILEKLGMRVSNLTDRLADQLGYEDEVGVVVTRVTQGGAAHRAGLQAGDLIVEVNKNKVANISDLNQVLSSTKPGDAIAIYIRRGASGRGYFGLKIPK